MRRLRVQDLVIDYVSDGYTVRAVDHLSFEASAGELVVILGPSGSGKTSLLSCLAGILTPTLGRIELDDLVVTDVRGDALTDYRRSHVGIVFQAFNLIASATARENVAAPMLMAGQPRSKALARADELLQLVGLADRARHKPGKLSGGQQQRVALARALMLNPPMVLADEPTANLDYINAESIIVLLRELREEGRLIIVSTHDQRMVPIADQVIRMVPDVHEEKGRPQRVEYAKGEAVFRQGERGELVYVIESGAVEILREFADGSEQQLAVLASGQYFGELAPLLGSRRSATARAQTDVVLTAYGVRAFREQVLGRPAEDGKRVIDLTEKRAPRRRRPARAK